MQEKHHRSLTVSFIVAIAFFMQFLDTTAVNTAIPTMAAWFGTDVIHISTGITSYVIALAVFIPVSVWVADRFGTRRVFSSAVAFFIIASALCGMSQNLGQFVACRILQGMAGAMMSPVGRLAVLKVTPKEDLPAAMNYITLPALVAPVVGPLVGGYLASVYELALDFLSEYSCRYCLCDIGVEVYTEGSVIGREQMENRSIFPVLCCRVWDSRQDLCMESRCSAAKVCRIMCRLW